MTRRGGWGAKLTFGNHVFLLKGRREANRKRTRRTESKKKKETNFSHVKRRQGDT